MTCLSNENYLKRKRSRIMERNSITICTNLQHWATYIYFLVEIDLKNFPAPPCLVKWNEPLVSLFYQQNYKTEEQVEDTNSTFRLVKLNVCKLRSTYTLDIGDKFHTTLQYESPNLRRRHGKHYRVQKRVALEKLDPIQPNPNQETKDQKCQLPSAKLPSSKQPSPQPQQISPIAQEEAPSHRVCS